MFSLTSYSIFTTSLYKNKKRCRFHSSELSSVCGLVFVLMWLTKQHLYKEKNVGGLANFGLVNLDPRFVWFKPQLSWYAGCFVGCVSYFY